MDRQKGWVKGWIDKRGTVKSGIDKRGMVKGGEGPLILTIRPISVKLTITSHTNNSTNISKTNKHL